MALAGAWVASAWAPAERYAPVAGQSEDFVAAILLDETGRVAGIRPVEAEPLRFSVDDGMRLVQIVVPRASLLGDDAETLPEAARAQVYASEQAQRGVVLSLVASVATSYITLRGLDRQREIAVATSAIFGETVRIFTLRYNAGLVSETELNEARAQYKLAQVTIPAVDQQIAALENGISILLGRNPGPVDWPSPVP